MSTSPSGSWWPLSLQRLVPLSSRSTAAMKATAAGTHSWGLVTAAGSTGTTTVCSVIVIILCKSVPPTSPPQGGVIQEDRQ